MEQVLPEWGMNGDQSARVKGGGLNLKAVGAQRRSYQTITQFRRVQEGSQEEVALEGLLKNDWGSSEE